MDSKKLAAPAVIPAEIRELSLRSSRFGGTLRRELLDHVVILSEEHLKRLLKEYIEEYYQLARPHQGLDGGTPFPTEKPEPATDATSLVSIPVAGGLHHRYVRVAAMMHLHGWTKPL